MVSFPFKKHVIPLSHTAFCMACWHRFCGMDGWLALCHPSGLRWKQVLWRVVIGGDEAGWQIQRFGGLVMCH